MNIKEYCKQVEVTRAPLELTLDDNTHMLFGMLTELGEITDVFKKYLAYEKDIDWVNVKEEIGDLMWYIAGFCNVNDLDLEEILQTNIDKLRARYPEKFNADKALNRDLNKERGILEGTSRLIQDKTEGVTTYTNASAGKIIRDERGVMVGIAYHDDKI